jgi:superoxide dismutase
VTNTRKLRMGPSQRKSTNIPLQGMGPSLYTPVYNGWAHIIDYMPYYDITVWAHAWYIYYQVVAYGPM